MDRIWIEPGPRIVSVCKSTPDEMLRRKAQTGRKRRWRWSGERKGEREGSEEGGQGMRIGEEVEEIRAGEGRGEGQAQSATAYKTKATRR